MGLSASFPLIEISTLFNLSWRSWLPIGASIILVAGIIVGRLIQLRPKHLSYPKTAAQAHPRSMASIRAETVGLLTKLDQQIASQAISPEYGANNLSAIARNHVDQVRLQRSRTMTLEEVRAMSMPGWLVELMTQCYEYEFSARTGVDIAHLRELVAQTIKEVQQWQ